MRTAATLACLALLAGCRTSSNDRAAIGESLVINSFAPAPRPLIDPPANHGIANPEQRDWAPIPFPVPVDGTAHRTLYTHYGEPSGSPREIGLYPNQETALDIDPPMSVGSALGAHGRTLVDLIVMPVEVFIRPPWKVRYSPDWPYERNGWTSAWLIDVPPATGGDQIVQP